jgi:FtsZ-interacting cell division protein ZipA
MSTVAIIAIIVGVIIVAAIVATAIRRRQFERKRAVAGELRDEAGMRRTRATKAEAEAEESARIARRERVAAEEHAERADELDPDVDDRESTSDRS